MTTFMYPQTNSPRLEIGSTWLATSAQGSRANREAKLLQLTYAFDELECIAVEFRTHWHNRQSRTARYCRLLDYREWVACRARGAETLTFQH